MALGFLGRKSEFTISGGVLLLQAGAAAADMALGQNGSGDLLSQHTPKSL